MSNPLYPFFPIVSFIGFVIALIPLPWHLQAWNSGTCFYMVWTSLACLNQFVNSMVWANDAINRAPILCDISIRITTGASFGIPASALCIVRRLYKIASSHNVSITRSEKRRAILVDTVIALVIPLVLTAMEYIVQGHRFNIFEEMGCVVALYNTPLAYVIAFMWPVIFGLISATYCVLSLIAFRRRQVELQQFLSSNTSLTLSRYLRLMALAVTETMCTTPLAVFAIVLNATATPVSPWVSWSDTHFNFSRVVLFPSLLWRTNRLLSISLELSRWAPVFCSLVFFCFFGFAEEARKNYAAAGRYIARIFGLSRLLGKIRTPFSEKASPLKPLALGSVHSLPVFVSRPTAEKRVSSTSDVIHITFDEKSRRADIESGPSTPTSATTASYCRMLTPTSGQFSPCSTSSPVLSDDLSLHRPYSSHQCREDECRSFHAI